MKKHFVVVAGLFGFLALTNVAMAADPVVDTAYDWSGAYVGVQAGYGWGDSGYELDFDGSPILQFSSSPQPDGFLGGLYAGYNFQTESMLVLGVEVDASLSGMSDDGSPWFQNGGPNPAGVGFADINWSGAARARIGYAADRFMPYITGGVAIAEVKFGYDLVSDPVTLSGKTTMLGWTIGAGVEYAITDSIQARLEYRYTDYGHDGTTLTGDDPDSPGRIDLQTSNILAGISFAF